MRYQNSSFWVVIGLLLFSLFLSACGGGGGEDSVVSSPVQQWPQSAAFTDFTGGQKDFVIAYRSIEYGPIEGSGQTNCLLCVRLRGVARSNAEMANLLKDFSSTPQSWPPPYNDKDYAELPIDYSNKMAIVLHDISAGTYGYSIQNVEESAEAMTVSVVKCDFALLIPSQVAYLGLLIPKSSKPVQVVTLPSPNPPVYPGSGQLGAC